MAYGIQCFNAAGQMTLDTTDRISRYYTTVTCPAIGKRASTWVAIPGYTLDGNWFIYVRTNVNFIQIQEQTDGLTITNLHYYNTSPVFTIDVFAG